MDVFGVEVCELPDGWTCLEVVVVAKALDDEGRVALAIRTSDTLNQWETVGMLRGAESTALGDLCAGFVDSDEP